MNYAVGFRSKTPPYNPGSRHYVNTPVMLYREDDLRMVKSRKQARIKPFADFTHAVTVHASLLITLCSSARPFHSMYIAKTIHISHNDSTY